MRQSSSEVRPAAMKSHRAGRRPKYPNGKRVVTRLRLPSYCHSAAYNEAEEAGLDLSDLVAYYVITGWQHKHPESTISMPAYLQRTWNHATSAAEPMVPLPEAHPKELSSDTLFLGRLPDTVHSAISAEAWEAGQAIGSMAVFYLLAGWNSAHADKLPIPPHLIEAWEAVRGAAIRPKQEAMLA